MSLKNFVIFYINQSNWINLKDLNEDLFIDDHFSCCFLSDERCKSVSFISSLKSKSWLWIIRYKHNARCEFMYHALSDVTDFQCLYYQVKISNKQKKRMSAKEMLMKITRWILSCKSDQAIETEKLSQQKSSEVNINMIVIKHKSWAR